MRNEVEQLHGQMLSNSSTHSTPAPAPAPFSASVSGGRDKQNGFQQQSQQTEKAGRGGAESLLSATQQSTAGSSQGARVSMDGLDREKFGILEVPVLFSFCSDAYLAAHNVIAVTSERFDIAICVLTYHCVA